MVYFDYNILCNKTNLTDFTKFKKKMTHAFIKGRTIINLTGVFYSETLYNNSNGDNNNNNRKNQLIEYISVNTISYSNTFDRYSCKICQLL